jgi:sugar/nucleoside kinase (ribokinase family)
MFADPGPESRMIDFLSIGHICHDRVPGGKVAGGAAAYGASVAATLGCRAAVVTSAAAEDDWQKSFPDLVIHQHISAATTIFENVYTSMGRVQTIHGVAGRLSTGDVPPEWTRVPVVHIGPIANEVDPAVVNLFTNSVIGIGPQGWMRRWDDQGHVYQVPWAEATEIIPLATVTFLSMEDMASPKELFAYQQLASVLVVTDSHRGCTIYTHGEERQFPAPVVEAVDTTGAGDIFAAAYLIRFHQTRGDVWEAARFANQIAGHSVVVRGLPEKMKQVRNLIETIS